jgi:hypothetical protein
MDPFLEHPDVFPGLHDRLIAYLSEFLQVSLPAPYYADIGRRAWIEVSQRYIGPDAEVPRRHSDPEIGGSGNVAVAAPANTEPVVIRVPHDEHREPFVEIYVGRGTDRRLVTSIEVLSLTNKTKGQQGRDLYLRKQREILNSKVNLVEVDLLRLGEHTTAVPIQLLVAKVDGFDYHVCVHRFDNLEDYFVYPIQLTWRLPVIAIPLLPDDHPVVLDLQAVFDRAYDAGPYKKEIRYDEDIPEPPLPEVLVPWAEKLLADSHGQSRLGQP